VLDTLTALVADNSRQEASIDRLRLLIALMLREEASSIDKHRLGTSDSAVVIVDSGRQTMIDLRNNLSEMDAEENRLLVIRGSTAATSAILMHIGAVAAFFLVCAAGALIVYYARRTFAALSAASDQLSNHERKLLESATRLKVVVDTAVDGRILIDANGRILKFNPACVKLFQYSVDEVFHQNVKMLMPSSYSVEHGGYIGNFVDTGDRKIGIGREVLGRRKDGSTFW
jgi:PAS domain S-box-containing protein